MAQIFMILIIPLAYSMPAEVFYLSHSAWKEGRKEGRQGRKEPRLGTLSLKSLMLCMKPEHLSIPTWRPFISVILLLHLPPHNWLTKNLYTHMLLFSKASYNIARLRLHAGLPRIPLACEIPRGCKLNYALELKPN